MLLENNLEHHFYDVMYLVKLVHCDIQKLPGIHAIYL